MLPYAIQMISVESRLYPGQILIRFVCFAALNGFDEIHECVPALITVDGNDLSMDFVHQRGRTFSRFSFSQIFEKCLLLIIELFIIRTEADTQDAGLRENRQAIISVSLSSQSSSSRGNLSSLTSAVPSG